MEVKLIYIAGHYTLEPETGTLAAATQADRIKKDGRAFPIAPHLLGGGNGDPAYMYRGTKELMRRCDAVLTLPRWESSKGALDEVRAADRMPIPVFHREGDLFRWLDGRNVGTTHGQRGTLPELCAGLPQTLVLQDTQTREQKEIRDWGKEHDSLIYTAETLNRIRIWNPLGAAFVQVME